MTRLLLAALACAAACVDVPRPATRRVARQVRAIREADAERERARRRALPHLTEAELASISVVDETPSLTRVLVGPLRVELRGAEAHAAADIPRAPIAHAVSVRGAWLFVTHQDDWYTAPAFTGRLTLLREGSCGRDARAPVEVPALVPGDGRASFVYADGRARWWDGARLGELRREGLVTVAWKGDVGLAVTDFEEALVSRDGGATWRALEGVAGVPLAAGGHPRGLFLFTSGGQQRLEGDRLVVVEDPVATDALFPDASRVDLGVTRQEAVAQVARDGFERVGPAACPPRREDGIDDARGQHPGLLGALALHRQLEHTELGWSWPGFSLELPRRRAPDGEWEAPVYPRYAPARLGTAEQRARGSEHGELRGAALVAMQRDGAEVTLTWRGVDAGGPYTTRVVARTPAGTDAEAAWRLVGTSRAGALYEIKMAEPAPPMAHGLHWFSAAGVRRVEDPVVASSRSAVEGAALVPLDDGGALLAIARDPRIPDGLLTWAHHGLCLVTALELGPDGAPRGVRVLASSPHLAQWAGLGGVGARRGIVVTRGDRRALTLLPFAGGREEMGAWTLESPPRLCGPRRADAPTLHVVTSVSEVAFPSLPIAVGPGFDAPDFAMPERATFEREGDGACLRSVFGALGWDAEDTCRRIERDEEHEDAPHGWTHLEARGGRMTGPADLGCARGAASLAVARDRSIEPDL